MKHAIYTWEKRWATGEHMPKELLKEEIERFIKARSNCSLATGYGTYIRNTPMRYNYKDGQFLFITEGGYKFKGLVQNENVCLSIFDTNNTSSDTIGLTINGIAKITEFTEKDRKIGEIRRFLITVTPTTIEYLNSTLTKRGFYMLQKLDL